MKKMMSKKVLGVIALALVCVMAGTAFGMNRPAAQAETVVVTSPDRKSTRLNSSHPTTSRMPSSA